MKVTINIIIKLFMFNAMQTIGPNDNYDLTKSHFFPALIKKIHNQSKKIKDHYFCLGNRKTKKRTYVC